MNLDALLSRVSASADDAFPDILVRLLTATIPEPPDCCCQKCGILLSTYVHFRLALHRLQKRHYEGPRQECYTSLHSHMMMARDAFHSSECYCGLELWRGPRWRAVQGDSYQRMYESYQRQKIRSHLHLYERISA